MAKFRKRPVDVRIRPVTQALIEELRGGGGLTDEGKLVTAEGSQEITPDVGWMVTGIEGENYVITKPEKFAEYVPTEGRPEYYYKPVDTSKTVDAVRVDFRIDIQRPGWVHGQDPGCFLIYGGNDDQYLVKGSIFRASYEPVDDEAREMLAFTPQPAEAAAGAAGD